MSNRVLYMMTAISIACAVYLYVTPPTLEESVQTLSRFGAKLGNATENNPISKEDEEKIKFLANTPIIIPKFAQNNAVVSTGINFLSVNNKEELTPVILNSITGKEVEPCGKIGIDDINNSGSNDNCGRIIELDERVKTALSITSPVDGKISVQGKMKDAKFVVLTHVFYEGSECTTTYINGNAYIECQSARPNRR